VHLEVALGDERKKRVRRDQPGVSPGPLGPVASRRFTQPLEDLGVAWSEPLRDRVIETDERSQRIPGRAPNVFEARLILGSEGQSYLSGGVETLSPLEVLEAGHDDVPADHRRQIRSWGLRHRHRRLMRS
jgi:hypothetical protein